MSVKIFLLAKIKKDQDITKQFFFSFIGGSGLFCQGFSKYFKALFTVGLLKDGTNLDMPHNFLCLDPLQFYTHAFSVEGQVKKSDPKSAIKKSRYK